MAKRRWYTWFSTLLCTALTWGCAGSDLWTIREGDAFQWASGAAAWGIEGNYTSRVAWMLGGLQDQEYRVFIGGYRTGRSVRVSLSGGEFSTAFGDPAGSRPSSVSGGVEFDAGTARAAKGELTVQVIHSDTQGVAYVDYFRLAPTGGGEPVLIEAESIVPRDLPLPTVQVPEPSPGEVRDAVESIHKLLWERFIDPETHLLYTEIPADGVSADSPGSVEDSSLCGGMYLDAMILRHLMTKDPADAEKARLIFRGLLDNTRLGGEPGYILRGFQPDRKRLLGDPSVDQYTGLLFGMWRYHRSAIATEEERGQIAQVFADVLTRLERDGWTIREPDGKLTRFGRLDMVTPTRAERLLSFLLMGCHVTRDTRWFDLYEGLLESRLPACTGFPETTSSWVAIQSQLSLRALRDLDANASRRETYWRGMSQCARIAWAQVPGGLTVAQPPDAGQPIGPQSLPVSPALRYPLDGISTALLSNARTLIPPATRRLALIAVYHDFRNCRDSRAIAPVEWNYWLARAGSLNR